MKRSASELALEEFISNWKTTVSMTTSSSDATKLLASFPDTITFDPTTPFTASPLLSNHFHFKDDHRHQDEEQEVMNDFSSKDGDVLFSQNLPPKSKQSILDSQSSICVSAGNNPKSRENEVRGATSASSDHDQSDDEEEDAETDPAGLSEQSLDPSYLKHLRRMLSNRESARRSRKRKQEHLTDLELQAERMRGENDSLYKQLANAHQQFRGANTNNRVLMSDVEALRAQVKLAEDTLAGGSSLICSSLNQLRVQSHLISPQPVPMVTHNLRRAANVSPTVTVHGDDSFYGGFTASGNSAPGLENVDISYGNLNDGIGGAW
ncbi:hypothetical protein DITRI_Ditri03aG0004800 [Diplodiscus trichospermus]